MSEALRMGIGRRLLLELRILGLIAAA